VEKSNDRATSVGNRAQALDVVEETLNNSSHYFNLMLHVELEKFAVVFVILQKLID
jgi:hypothetical protein